MSRSVLCVLLLAACASALASGGGGHGGANSWQNWHAANEVDNIASLQRGARNFFSYCAGCHSLKYMRYARMSEDLAIPEAQMQQFLTPPGAKLTDYAVTNMPAADAENWFGKAPPDLSLMARARGVDYIYQFLKTFYLDESQPVGVNNLRLQGTAMPHVLAELEGVKRAVFRDVERHGENGETTVKKEFERFEQVVPGRMRPEEYDNFVRDTVNFLDYVSEPTQTDRRALGVWVILFLLVFTWLAWLLKKEYWKDVH